MQQIEYNLEATYCSKTVREFLCRYASKGWSVHTFNADDSGRMYFLFQRYVEHRETSPDNTRRTIHRSEAAI